MPISGTHTHIHTHTVGCMPPKYVYVILKWGDTNGQHLSQNQSSGERTGFWRGLGKGGGSGQWAVDNRGVKSRTSYSSYQRAASWPSSLSSF